MGVHETAGTLEAGCLNLRPATQQRADPLFVDGIGPLRAVEVRYGEFEQEVAQRCRVQDGGVEKRDGNRQRSIAQVEFLGVGGEFVERPAPSSIRPVFVAEDLVEAHASVRPDLAEGNGAGLEEPDEEGARDVEEVGRLLGRQFGVLAKYRNGASRGHVVEDLQEEWADRCG